MSVWQEHEEIPHQEAQRDTESGIEGYYNDHADEHPKGEDGESIGIPMHSEEHPKGEDGEFIGIPMERSEL